MTPNPHTKFEHNRPSRFRDTEARFGGISARARVQRFIYLLQFFVASNTRLAFKPQRHTDSAAVA